VTIEKVVCTCSRYPNQFEGVVDGKQFYFRARHGEWRLQVNERGASEDDMCEWPVVSSGSAETGPDGGSDPAEVEVFVRELLEHYSAGRCPHCNGTGRNPPAAGASMGEP
jgi:hypothetical protein